MSRTLRAVFAILAVVVLVWAARPGAWVSSGIAPSSVSTGSGPGRLVVDLIDDDARADDAALAEVARVTGGAPSWASEWSRDEGLIVVDVADLAAAQAAISGLSGVEAAEPEVAYAALGYPDDPEFERQWHLRAMGAPAGWATTPRGAGVVVAVVDTGVTQVDDLLQTVVLDGASFIPGVKSAADDNGHGTHCAGTIAQSTNNGRGAAGVAPAAQILPVKVLSAGGFGTSAGIAAGIDWAVDAGADVLSLSLGGGYSAVVHTAVARARERGVLVFAAAGNTGRQGVSFPGALVEAVGVSAVGPDGALAPYSSWGQGVDLAAPGGDKRTPGGGVFQDTIDGKGGHQVAEYQGTSMATPHVAGAAAVLLSMGLSPDAVERALLASADGTGAWEPRLGHGRLDLAAALRRVSEGQGAWRFVLAALAMGLISSAAPVRARFIVTSVAVAAWIGGGAFFLAWSPWASNPWVAWMSRPFLHWPLLVASGDVVNFPLWLSAALPALAAFTLGAFRPTRAPAAGFAVGVGAHLFVGATNGTLHPWGFGSAGEIGWLAANAAACAVLALALVGAERLDDREGR